MEIRDEVIRVVAEQADRTPESIGPEHVLMEDIGLDSLGVVEISMELENVFDIVIEDEDMEKVRTVGDVIDMIGRLTRAAGRGGA